MAAFLAFAVASLLPAIRLSGATSFRPSMPASSGSTSAARPARGSSRRRPTSSRSKTIIRQVIPAAELDVINDNIGLPNNINLALERQRHGRAVGRRDPRRAAADASTRPPAISQTLRAELPRRFPDLEFFTQPADIVSQILNFGLPAPIDIQISGPIGESDRNYQAAQQIARDLSVVPGAVDVHVQQITGAPRLMVDTDRVMAQQSGLTEQNIADSLSVSLAGSGTASHQFLAELQERRELPGRGADAAAPRQLDRRAEPDADRGGERRRAAVAQQPRDDQPDDDAALAEPLQRAAGVRCVRERAGHRSRHASPTRSIEIVARYRRQISNASTITVRGQVQSMKQAFLRDGIRDRLRGAAGVLPDGRQFPVLDGSVHHPHGAPGRAGRHSVGAVRHRICGKPKKLATSRRPPAISRT